MKNFRYANPSNTNNMMLLTLYQPSYLQRPGQAMMPEWIFNASFKIQLSTSLKGLYSDKLSGDGQIFQVWPYLNSLIIIKLPFSQQKHVQTFPLPLPSKTCALPFDFALERDPKNTFYYHHVVENYMDQVLNFSLFERHEYIHTESSGL